MRTDGVMRGTVAPSIPAGTSTSLPPAADLDRAETRDAERPPSPECECECPSVVPPKSEVSGAAVAALTA
jgi:hypothetical protein